MTKRQELWDDPPATCAICGKKAYLIDHLFPYHSEMNRCRKCMKIKPKKKCCKNCKFFTPDWKCKGLGICEFFTMIKMCLLPEWAQKSTAVYHKHGTTCQTYEEK